MRILGLSCVALILSCSGPQQKTETGEMFIDRVATSDEINQQYLRAASAR